MRDYAKLNLRVERHRRRRRSILLGFGIFALSVFTFFLGFLVGQEIQNSVELRTSEERQEAPRTAAANVSTSSAASSRLPSSSTVKTTLPDRPAPLPSREPVLQSEDKTRKTSAVPSPPEVGEKTKKERAPVVANQERDSEPPSSDPPANYTLQIAAFREKDRAQRLARDLEKKNYKPYIVSTDNSRNESWYLVRIGRFRTAEMARQYAQSLEEKEKISALVWKITP